MMSVKEAAYTLYNIGEKFENEDPPLEELFLKTTDNLLARIWHSIRRTPHQPLTIEKKNFFYNFKVRLFGKSEHISDNSAVAKELKKLHNCIEKSTQAEFVRQIPGNKKQIEARIERGRQQLESKIQELENKELQNTQRKEQVSQLFKQFALQWKSTPKIVKKEAVRSKSVPTIRRPLKTVASKTLSERHIADALRASGAISHVEKRRSRSQRFDAPSPTPIQQKEPPVKELEEALNECRVLQILPDGEFDVSLEKVKEVLDFVKKLNEIGSSDVDPLIKRLKSGLVKVFTDRMSLEDSLLACIGDNPSIMKTLPQHPALITLLNSVLGEETVDQKCRAIKKTALIDSTKQEIDAIAMQVKNDANALHSAAEAKQKDKYSEMLTLANSVIAKNLERLNEAKAKAKLAEDADIDKDISELETVYNEMVKDHESLAQANFLQTFRLNGRHFKTFDELKSHFLNEYNSKNDGSLHYLVNRRIFNEINGFKDAIALVERIEKLNDREYFHKLLLDEFLNVCEKVVGKNEKIEQQRQILKSNDSCEAITEAIFKNLNEFHWEENPPLWSFDHYHKELLRSLRYL